MKANTISLRQARPNEINIVLALLKEAAQWLQKQKIDYWQNWLEPPDPHINWIREGFEQNEFFIVEQANAIIGCFRLQWADDDFWGPRTDQAGYIHSFTIRRNLAGRGLGALVLKEIERYCRNLSRDYLRLDCGSHVTELCHYYEAQGFKNVGSVTVHGEHLRLFEKALQPNESSGQKNSGIISENNSAHFWSGGSDVHLKELKKQEEAELVPLQQKLEQTADPEDQKALKQQIRKVKKEYRAIRKASGTSLF